MPKASGGLLVEAMDASQLVQGFPPIWLRDNCRCEECVDVTSGQKRHGILDVPAEASIESVQATDENVVVTTGPDGHHCIFPKGVLEGATANPTKDLRTEHGKTLWTALDLGGEIPRVRWADYVSSNTTRLEALTFVARFGFVLAVGTPLSDGTVLEVARSFGFVRETNYGELFEVRVETAPSNLAFTGLGLSPHTDNPYRDPVPTMQLLHCLQNAVEGGDSGLVDGFAAAAALRQESPTDFAMLTELSVPFAWSDASASLRAERPLITASHEGAVKEIRFNNRSMQPMRGARRVLEDFYQAYRHFAEVVMRPEMQVTFRLEPGDCLIFDNTRLLHSRTALSDRSHGTRHLQGCYADLDGLYSSIAVLGGQS